MEEQIGGGTEYALKTKIDAGFEAAGETVRNALATEGFGVLTVIDVRAKMEEKLGKRMPNHVILGACNPSLAHQALVAEHDVGLFLPCNVVLYEGDGVTPGSEDGLVTVVALRPRVAMEVVKNEPLASIAAEAEKKLARVIKNVENGRRRKSKE